MIKICNRIKLQNQQNSIKSVLIKADLAYLKRGRCVQKARLHWNAKVTRRLRLCLEFKIFDLYKGAKQNDKN